MSKKVSCTLGFYSPELPRDVPWIIFHVVGTFGYVAELHQKVSEAKKVVKLAIPQASWKEFGIHDSK